LPGLKEFGQQLLSTGDVTEDVAVLVNLGMQQRIAGLQQADRRYWRDIIVELKQLRSTRKLMSGGIAV
jgi:hypothetical protein